MQHAFNSLGEKKLGKYYVDGYIEWETEDGLTTIGYEYNGCRFHRCPFECGIESVQTDEQYENQLKKLAFLKRNLSIVRVIQGCQWREQKKQLMEQSYKIESDVSPFLCQKKITEENILEAISNGSLYGICCVDIETPNEICEKYKDLNFPVIFNNLEITEDMLNPEMLAAAKNKNLDFPISAKSLSWNSKAYIGCTPLLRFYMQLGMKISNVRWALQYQSAQPFKKFVDSLVEVRIDATRTKNGPLGDRAKFVLNSGVGMLKKIN